MSYTYEELEGFAAYVNWALGGERMDLDEMGRRIKELKADNEALGNDWNTYRGYLSRLNELTGCCNPPHSMVAVKGWKDALNRVCKALGLTDGKGLPDQPEFILDEIERRLTPKGVCWPTFDDGGRVDFGDVAQEADCPAFTVEGVEFQEPAVLLAVTLWGRDDEGNRVTYTLQQGEEALRPPILAKDGEPIEVGQRLYGEDGRMWEVLGLHHSERYPVEGWSIVVPTGDEIEKRLKAEWLTHEKPEPTDTWERIEDDCKCWPASYCERHGIDTVPYGSETEFALDLVRRAKALSERGVDRPGEVE